MSPHLVAMELFGLPFAKVALNCCINCNSNGYVECASVCAYACGAFYASDSIFVHWTNESRYTKGEQHMALIWTQNPKCCFAFSRLIIKFAIAATEVAVIFQLIIKCVNLSVALVYCWLVIYTATSEEFYASWHCMNIVCVCVCVFLYFDISFR